jgi:hypothetical protein
VLAEPGRALLVSGPAALLLHTGDVLTACGEWIASDRQVHRQGWSLLDSLTGLLRDGGPAPRCPELDLVGADPLFHTSLHRKRAREGRRGQAGTGGGVNTPNRFPAGSRR